MEIHLFDINLGSGFQGETHGFADGRSEDVGEVYVRIDPRPDEELTAVVELAELSGALHPLRDFVINPFRRVCVVIIRY